MRFVETDEQRALSEAARDALARTPTLKLARAALDGGARPDLWQTACRAGWPGLVTSEDEGGVGLGAADALLVLREAGRVLADAGLLGHLPATALLSGTGHPALPAIASGERRAVFEGAQPPGDLEPDWTVDARIGSRRGRPPVMRRDGTVDGEVGWVPDAPSGAVFIIAACREDMTPVAAVVDAAAPGVHVEQAGSYDPTRSLGHLVLREARALTVAPAREDALSHAWYFTQALLAAESLGAVDAALDLAVAYAKERSTFGRPIGSYQAVKHALVEVLRLCENASCLVTYAGWALDNSPGEVALAASAARAAAGSALELAARTTISVHGGIGATWEHDAPLYFRRAQTARRMLGGHGQAIDRVAGEVLAGAASA